MVKKKISHFIPLLLALVILIGCIPPIHASAASSLTLPAQVKILSGWETDVSHGDLRAFCISVDAYVYKNGSIVDIVEIYLDPEEPGVLGATLANGAGQDRLWYSDGDHVAENGIIYFRSTLTITDDFACAFFSAYSQSAVLSRLVVDDQVLHQHNSPWVSQSIVDENGTTFECSICDWVFPWAPSGSGVFSGFTDQFGHSHFGQVTFALNASLLLTSVYTDPEPEPEPVLDYALYVDGQLLHSHSVFWCSQSIIDENGLTFNCSQCLWEQVWVPVDSGVFSGFVSQFNVSYFGQSVINVYGATYLNSVYVDPEPVTYTTYSKVTQNLADWTGTYIIVYEVSTTQGYVFTGVDEKLNSLLLSVDSGKILVSSDQAVCPVRIEPYGTGYSIKLLSGANADKYIYSGTGTSNKISFATVPKQLTVSQVGTISYILDGEIPFQFNKTSSYLWFRFFGSKPGGQSEIALYKLDDGTGGGSSPAPSYKLIIDDHEEHSHAYAWGCQTVVEPTGAVFECPCGWSLIWNATGTGTFSGFKDQAGNVYFGQCAFEVDGELCLTSIYDQSTPDPGTTYSSTITIDGVKYTFTSSKEKPAVTLQVTSGGVTMSYGDQEKYSLSGTSKTFLGLSYVSGGSASLIPGETYKLAAGDHTLYMIYADTSTKFMLQTGQWQAKFNSAAGTYYDLYSWPNGLEAVPLSFISSGSAFNEVSFMTDNTGARYLLFGDTAVYAFDAIEMVRPVGWLADTYALVYFAVDQEVPEAFYKWFMANFTRTGDQMASPVYSATINIYDNTGATLLQSFTFTDVSSLKVSLDMTGQSCVFRGNSLSSAWDPTSSMFSGFALAPGSAYPVFSSGFSYELPIDAFPGVPVTLNFYVTSGSTGSDDANEDIQAILAGFIATFVAPVMFFFSIEFIPGFSIGKLCLFAFCFGLLFWFLKVVR